jgi:hypothetical protein
MMRGIYVPCQTCLHRWRCSLAPGKHLEALHAFAHDLPCVDCVDHRLPEISPRPSVGVQRERIRHAFD